MDKLKKYLLMKSEISDLEYRIRKEYSVVDTVQGSSKNSPYTLHSIEVSGVARNPYTKEVARLKEEVRAIEAFIDSVPDVLVRQALRLKCMDGLEWRQVAQRIGGGNSTDCVKKQVYRYLGRS